MRYYKRVAGSDLRQFNRDVLSCLADMSVAHMDALNRQGISLGWWKDIAYMHSQRYTPGQVAGAIARKPLPE